MIDSTYFSTNPALYSFLPMFYMVWADAVLTPSEMQRIRSLIDDQVWLEQEEKNFLLSNLDPSDPPSAEELKSWLFEIRRVADFISPSMRDSLVEIGIKLAALNARNQDPETLDKARAPLTNIEEALGVISSEAAYHLRSVHRKSINDDPENNHLFQVSKMTRVLDGDDAEIISKIKTFLSDQVFEYADESQLDSYREKVLEWCQYFADQGFGAIGYPTEFGGGGSMRNYFAVMETMSYHDLSLTIKYGVQFGLFGMSVMSLGTQKHHEKYLADIGSLKLPGCFAMTETNHGSNVKGIETLAIYDHAKRSFLIHTPNEKACKEYIGNAAVHGEMATVFAKLMVDGTDYGVNAFLVPLRDKNKNLLQGIRIADCGRKMGLNGVDNGRIWFENVEIPYENMLDRFSAIDEDGRYTSPISSDNRRFFTMLGTLVGGRIGVPRSALSAAKSGLTIAIRYASERRQFGPENREEVPILNYRTFQRRLMPLLSRNYATHFALQYVTRRFVNRSDAEIQEIEALSAGLKAYTTWGTTKTLQECREAMGGKGYLSENRIDRLKNDTDIYTTFEGDNTVLMQLVAKSRLSEFKKEFADLSIFGMIGQIADRARVSFETANPLVVRNTSTEHLLDTKFHLELLRSREHDVLVSAAKRIKKKIDDGVDSFEAINQTQFHLQEVAFAFIERVVLEQFVLAVERVEDEDVQGALKMLCQLYALTTIENKKGWYLENDYMEGIKTKAIRKLINELCYDVRQIAVPLVNAFKIPESCLGAKVLDV